MTLLDSMLPISMPKIGMKYRALNTFSTLSTIPIKYKPTHTTLHKKPADMGRSRIFLFNCVRANAVCDATNIMTITHRKFIHGLFHKNKYFRYIPIRKSCTIMRAVPIRVAFNRPVLKD